MTQNNETTPEEYKAASDKLAQQDAAPKKELQEAALSGEALRTQLRKMGKRSLYQKKLDNRRKMRALGHEKPKFVKPVYHERKVDCAHTKALEINARIDKRIAKLTQTEAPVKADNPASL